MKTVFDTEIEGKDEFWDFVMDENHILYRWSTQEAVYLTTNSSIFDN